MEGHPTARSGDLAHLEKFSKDDKLFFLLSFDCDVYDLSRSQRYSYKDKGIKPIPL
jgi:hypothetical protein